MTTCFKAAKNTPSHIKMFGISLSIKEAMKKRMIYEIMPLMKEYFANGLMLKAQDEFADYYHLYTNQFMYL